MYLSLSLIQHCLDHYRGTGADEEANDMQKMVLVALCSKIMEVCSPTLCIHYTCTLYICMLHSYCACSSVLVLIIYVIFMIHHCVCCVHVYSWLAISVLEWWRERTTLLILLSTSHATLTSRPPSEDTLTL